MLPLVGSPGRKLPAVCPTVRTGLVAFYQHDKGYPDYRSPSGWNALLPPRQCAAALAEDISCDLAIVGAGYTGIAAAKRWSLLRPEDSIVMLDASEIGEGNPGRNSGFLLEIALADDARADAVARLHTCNRLIGDTLRDMVAQVAAARLPCQLQRAGTYRAAAGARGVESLMRYRAFLDAAGLPYEWLSRAQLEQRLGTGFYREGLYSPHCYLAQPAELIRALADGLADSVSLFEHSPVERLVADAGRWRLHTAHHSITAEKVILANNAFVKDLGVARDRVVAMYTSAGLTEPLSRSALEQFGEVEDWGLLPAHRLGSTLRRTVDGRLLIRSLYGYEAEQDPLRVARDLRGALIRRYPEAELPPFAHVWSGATGFTLNGGPIWGEIGDNLYVSAGCNGGGVVKGTLFGQALAELAGNQSTVDIPGLFGHASWMPPEPIRRWGFKLISSLELRHGTSER